ADGARAQHHGARKSRRSRFIVGETDRAARRRNSRRGGARNLERALIVTCETFGQTPLNQEELRGLIPAWVATHADLNLAEQTSTANAEPWCFAPRTRAPDPRNIRQSG